jgi:two-component system, sensor histidine kinase
MLRVHLGAMNIRNKFVLILGLALAINLISGFYTLHTYRDAAARSDRIRDHSFTVVNTSLSAQVHFKKQVQEWKNVLLRGHETDLYNRYLGQFYTEERQTREHIGKLIRLLEHNSEAGETAREFLDAHQRLGGQYRQALGLFRPESIAPHIDVDLEVRGIDRRPTDLLDRVVELAHQHKAQRLEGIGEQVAQSERHVLVIFLATAALLILVVYSLIDRMIARRILAATAVANRISRGDLSGVIDVEGRDEAAQLLQAMQSMQSNLGESRNSLREERALLAQRVQERTEELNIANAELEKTAQAKDAFLASMSHELRTPLTTMMGLTEILSDQLYGPLNSNQEKALETIMESSQHLLALINDVLDVAKVEAGKMELTRDEVPVQQLAESSLRMIRQQAQKKGLHVTSDIDPGVRLVWGDPRRLKQVLINLLGNAVKFTPEGGAIGLEVRGDRDKGEIQFRVRDSGIGIPAHELGRLFRPFVQVGNSVTRSDGGTGLGLALVYRMTQLHGGRVEVESAPGKGSLFTVFIPWSEAGTESSLPPESDATEPGSLVFPDDATILVAEDNPTIQSLLREYLEKYGLRVLLVNDGRSALEQIQQYRPDLVLMDVRLPVMDGLETVGRVRQDPALNRVIVIALTALAMPGDRERCLEAGMDDYVSKPVGMRELMLLIASHLNRGQRHS